MNRPAILTKPTAPSPSQQHTALFRIYVVYRSLLSVVLLIMLISPNTRQLVGSMNPSLYVSVALLYLATSVLLMGSLATSWKQNQKLLFLVFLVDIVAITLLADASGGMSSGLPILLVISVAASAVLISNRTLATLVAAISVLAILLDVLRLIIQEQMDVSALFPAGLLGTLIFGVSLMVQVIASRLGRAEELARNRASELYNLQRLNEQIVQHLQTGILLVNSEGRVRIMNKAATQLLAPQRPITMEHGRSIHEYSSDLAAQFTHWRATGHHRAKPFSVTDEAPTITANFRQLQSSTAGDALVFVEDYSPVTQYAQSLKLTSLGRLTASIAHEIRNPLGAISHAAQLLQESSELSAPDQRLADIIVEHSARVNRIVESVMQISRKGPPKPEYLLLAQWLAEFVGSYLATLNDSARVTVDCSYRDLQVEFDPENLQRVLSNLLDNALRHSELETGTKSASVVVALDFVSNQCLIDVIDQGAGVPVRDRAKLFEPFFTTVAEGSGMGLYLCKELCEINDAVLSYRTTDAGESCFRLSLNSRAM